MRQEQAGQHLRGERPVRPDEVHERPPRRLGDVVPRRVAAEEDELADPLGLAAANRDVARSRTSRGRRPAGRRCSRGGRCRARARRTRPTAAGSPVGEADAETVVAHDPVPARELPWKARRARSSHSSSRCEIQRLANTSGGPSPNVAYATRRPSSSRADLLLHHPPVCWRFGPCQQDGPRRRRGGPGTGGTIRPCRRATCTGSPSGRSGTATLGPSRPSSPPGPDFPGAAVRRAEAAGLGRRARAPGPRRRASPRARRVGRRRCRALPESRSSSGTVRRRRDRLRRGRRTSGRGIGSTLAQELAADALAAGSRRPGPRSRATTPRVVSLLRRVAGSVRETWPAAVTGQCCASSAEPRRSSSTDDDPAPGVRRLSGDPSRARPQ